MATAALYLITGTSGVGKSTLVEGLKQRLSAACFAVHDFDEGGVPANADAAWRQKRTAAWVKQAEANAQQGKSTVVCGVIAPNEVICPASLSTHFCLLSASPELISSRLQSRGWSEALIHDNLVWAEHLKSQVLAKPLHQVVSVDELTPAAVAKTVVGWILTSTPS